MQNLAENLVVSFVHGYSNLDINLTGDRKPALWQIKADAGQCFSYPFPRNPADFSDFKSLIDGDKPSSDARDFKKLPRFGLTGLSQTDSYLFAGSWNGVYKINKDGLVLERIISSRLMNDLHGIYADEEVIITCLTSKDLIVIHDHDGAIIDYFEVQSNLELASDKSVEEIDWRFVSKQFRGSAGYWHFNHIQKYGDELWLTSRNASSFVVVNLKTRTARLRLMNTCTPVLLHDGKRVDGKHYLTSIDGKILIAEPFESAGVNPANREDPGNMHLYNKDLTVFLLRLNETELGREPNWCRGLDVRNGIIYVTIDGRYDTDLSFGLLALREHDQSLLFNKRLRWADIGDEDQIRYVTGFDVQCL